MTLEKALAHSLTLRATPSGPHASSSGLTRGMSQASSRRASARREESLHPKDLVWAWISVTSTEMRGSMWLPPALPTSTLVGEEEK